MRGKILIAILLSAMSLRGVLGIRNCEANDDHISVVNLILSTHKLPEKNDCWSCYQPKLYYVVCAALIKPLHITDYCSEMRAMQLINVMVSFFILLLAWEFIKEFHFSEANKLLLFALFAFNPCILGINVQGTNDTFAIFFGMLGVYAVSRLFREMKIVWALTITIALIAGMLSKASVAVIVILILLSFLCKILFGGVYAERIKAMKYFLIIFISIATIVPYAGGYYHNYKQYHSLTLSTWEKDVPPHFFEKTPVYRAGLLSMFECFFTFRYLDMIRQPYINNEPDNYPLHRTSLWSQLYGRTVFMHFDQWPPSWASQSFFIVCVGRALIILGIVPLIIFLTGIFINIRVLILKTWQMDGAYFAEPLNYFYLLITLAYLSSSVFYTYNYRDFSSMKSIYIFPGLLAYIKMFSDGYYVFERRKTAPYINGALVSIIVLSIGDIGFLIYQLW